MGAKELIETAYKDDFKRHLSLEIEISFGGILHISPDTMMHPTIAPTVSTAIVSLGFSINPRAVGKSDNSFKKVSSSILLKNKFIRNKNYKAIIAGRWL